MTDEVNYYELVQGTRQFAEIKLDVDDERLSRDIYYMIDTFDDGTFKVTKIPLTVLWHSEAAPIDGRKVRKPLRERVEQVIKHNEMDK